MKCPRENCSNEARNDKRLGILPCESCITQDRQTEMRRPPEFATMSQTDRIQNQRDLHNKDTLQPWIGTKINPDFARAYPTYAENYYTKSSLEKL